jgi:hypothetical protein
VARRGRGGHGRAGRGAAALAPLSTPSGAYVRDLPEVWCAKRRVQRRCPARAPRGRHHPAATWMRLERAAEQRRFHRARSTACRTSGGCPVRPHALGRPHGIARVRAQRRTPAREHVCRSADQSHFGRRFKQILGVAPAAYRRAVGSTYAPSPRPTYLAEASAC